MKPLLAVTVTSLLLLSTSAFPQTKQNPNFLNKTQSLSTLSTHSDWLNNAEKFIAESEYFFKKPVNATSCIFYTTNKKQRITFSITPDGYKVSSIKSTNEKFLPWQQNFSFVEINKGDIPLKAEGNFTVSHEQSFLTFTYPDFSIEYINNEGGLRQNFIVENKPTGNNNLEVLLKIEGDLKLQLNSNGLLLADKTGHTQLFYNDLKVWDANNKKLDATMQIRDNNHLAIVVNDNNAQYPITVDPINKTAEWNISADGILPNLVGQLAIDAAYGFSVAGLGDVNGDGYDDVAIGAPMMADVVNGNGELASVGAVFIYYGSHSGLSTNPDAVLQPNTPVAGALFGYSIAGGDVNGDGKNDIIIGAPMDVVNISIGQGNIVSGKVGKVYVYDGAGLNNNNPDPLLTLELNGKGILEHNVNLSVNALFGFSVAVTEDLNNDGKKDIIVGAPTYAGIKLGLLNEPILDVQSGGAFIFLTADNNTTSLVKLEPIKTGLLGLPILQNNINGLLFGYSVDGLGDYNGDGNPDVVASAPAGIDLSSLGALLNGKILQGSALVYYGNGAGINTNVGATLTATEDGLLSNLLGTLANTVNLFGVSVKGLKDGFGTRTGGVLIGAPLGGALVNVLNLQLKTGTVNIFNKKNVSPVGNVAPDQVLQSPRNSNNILQLIQSNVLFGYSVDNTLDVNCDGFNDIIVGEPVSSGLQLINANVAGGAAYVYLGEFNDHFKLDPSWTMTATEDAFLGINATSLIGYSVAGAGHIKGASFNSRVLIGTPSRAVDLGAGLLNLGATLGNLYSLTLGDNGVGKGYLFNTELCADPGVLPITLINFSGNYKNGLSHLNWKTSQEINSNYFEIEHSTDGIIFNNIGMVKATGGPSQQTNYVFNDNKVNAGINYYRLKIIDKDNKYSYSKIIMLNANIKGIIITGIYPTPFKDKIYINVLAEEAATVNISLLDNAGKQLINYQNKVMIGSNILQLNNLDYLSKGMYIIKVQTDQTIITQKLIK